MTTPKPLGLKKPSRSPACTGIRASILLAPPATVPFASPMIWTVLGPIWRSTFRLTGNGGAAETRFTFILVITPETGAAVGRGLLADEISNSVIGALVGSVPTQASPNSVAAEAPAAPSSEMASAALIAAAMSLNLMVCLSLWLGLRSLTLELQFQRFRRHRARDAGSRDRHLERQLLARRQFLQLVLQSFGEEQAELAEGAGHEILGPTVELGFLAFAQFGHAFDGDRGRGAAGDEHGNRALLHLGAGRESDRWACHMEGGALRAEVLGLVAIAVVVGVGLDRGEKGNPKVGGGA